VPTLSKKSIAERELIAALKSIKVAATEGEGICYPLTYIAGWLSVVPQLHDLHQAFKDAEEFLNSTGAA
jgi:hypothetical protein